MRAVVEAHLRLEGVDAPLVVGRDLPETLPLHAGRRVPGEVARDRRLDDHDLVRVDGLDELTEHGDAEDAGDHEEHGEDAVERHGFPLLCGRCTPAGAFRAPVSGGMIGSDDPSDLPSEAPEALHGHERGRGTQALPGLRHHRTSTAGSACRSAARVLKEPDRARTTSGAGRRACRTRTRSTSTSAYAAESRFGRLVAPQSFARLHRRQPRRGPRDPGHDPRHAHALRRRRVVVLRRRASSPATAIRHDRMLFDYKVDRDQVRRADHVLARRHHLHQPARRGRLQAALDLDPLPAPRTRASAACSRTTAEPTLDRRGARRTSRSRSSSTTRASSTSAHDRRLFVKEGDKLPRRPIGPHTIASFTTEWRAYLMTVWGAFARVRRARPRSTGGLAARDVARPRGREDRPDAAPTASTRARRAATCRRAMRS